jgi:hypothetical protein
MITGYFASLAGTAAITVAISASAIGTASIFLANLESHGVAMNSPEQAFEAADNVCSLIAEGEPYETLIQRGVSDAGLTNEQVRYLAEQSVFFYCPESTPVLPR